MKNASCSRFKRFFCALTLGVATLASVSSASAKLFDGGLDSENLGKGDHIYIVGYATNRLGGFVPGVTDIPSLMSYERNKGMNYLVVKAGTGSTNYNGTGTSPQFRIWSD
jgi:hypothetical protein